MTAPTGEMKKCFLFGDPVSHSASPAMQNAAFMGGGLPYRYEARRVSKEELKRAVKTLRAPEVAGANITIPHKQAVMQYLDRVDDTAKAIGAVNTIVNTNGKLSGSNTDWLGAVRALEEKLSLEGKRVLVAGAGGGARAVIHGLLQRGARVTILARDTEKAKALAEESGCAHDALSNLGKTRADILINTTPAGMHPDEGRSIAAPEQLKSFQVVFDLVYNPLRTRLLREAEEAGCTTVEGLKMLVFQGAESFRMWTGAEPDVRLMYDTARTFLEGGQ